MKMKIEDEEEDGEKLTGEFRLEILEHDNAEPVTLVVADGSVTLINIHRDVLHLGNSDTGRVLLDFEGELGLLNNLLLLFLSGLGLFLLGVLAVDLHGLQRKEKG